MTRENEMETNNKTGNEQHLMQPVNRWWWRCFYVTAMAMVMAIGLLTISTLDAAAADVTYTGVYTPDGSDPTLVIFKNTTPTSKLCLSNCSREPIAIDIPIQLNKRYISGGTARQQFYLKLPSKQRVSMRDPINNNSSEILVAVSTITGRTNLVNLFGFNTSIFSIPNGGCRPESTISASGKLIFLWQVTQPDAPQACSTPIIHKDNLATGTYQFDFALGLKIEHSSLSKMPGGRYTGSLTYGIGPNQDIDFGDEAVSSDTQLTIHFEFTVKNAFKIEFPAGSLQALLQPRGGWDNYRDTGLIPIKLLSELPFKTTTSDSFSLYTKCEYQSAKNDGRCAIRNSKAPHDEVALSIAATIFGMDNNQGAATDLELWDTKTADSTLTPTDQQINRASKIRFQVEQSGVKQMLQHPDTTYKGNVTLIFDADI
jgi:hypothetical protein